MNDSRSSTDSPHALATLSPWARLELAWSIVFLAGLALAATSWGVPNLPPWLGAIGVVVSVLALLAWWRGRAEVRRAVGRGDRWASERAQSGANAYASLVLLAALGAALTAISTRREKSIDLSSSGINSLAPQTRAILRGLDDLKGDLKGAVRLVLAYAGSTPPPEALSLLQLYAQNSPRLEVATLDAALNPAEAARLSLRLSPNQATILVLREGAPAGSSTSSPTTARQPQAQREVPVISGRVDEAALSSAILGVSQSRARQVYALTGHGEAALQAGRGEVFNTLIGDLQGLNARVRRLALGAKSPVPKDTDVILVIAPRSDLLEEEEKALRQYFEGGGGIVLWLEPSAAPPARWRALLKYLGLEWKPGVVLDSAQSALGSPSVARGPLEDDILGTVSSEPVRARVLRGASGDGVFPGAAPLVPSASARSMHPLLSTSVQAVAQAASTRAREQPVVVARGPFLLACAIERGKSRAVVVGDAEFASDQFAGYFGNRSIAQACLNWAAGEDALVEIPPRAPTSNVLSMPSDDQATSRFFSLAALPALLFAWGLWNRWRKR